MCDATMHHIMKSKTVRDLRYRFSEIEALLNHGETIEIRKRQKIIARLEPMRIEPGKYPDFAARQRQIFGNKKTALTGTELVSKARGKY